MKKYILSIIASMFIGATYAQEISINSRENGIRHISCRMEPVKAKMTDKTSLSTSLSYIANDTEHLYNISFFLRKYTSLKVEKGADVLIRLNDENETVLTLTVINGDEDKIGHLVKEPIVTTEYRIFVACNITDEQVAAIAEHGVKKLRINTSTSPTDWEYKSDKIGGIISSHYKLIQETISKPADNDASTF